MIQTSNVSARNILYYIWNQKHWVHFSKKYRILRNRRIKLKITVWNKDFVEGKFQYIFFQYLMWKSLFHQHKRISREFCTSCVIIQISEHSDWKMVAMNKERRHKKYINHSALSVIVRFYNIFLFSTFKSN